MSKRDAKTSVAPFFAFADTPLSRTARTFLVLIQVVCPLLFFTNLTRNPYYTQIALLYVGVGACGFFWALEAFKSAEWKLPRLGFEIPLLLFLGSAFFSLVLSWVQHPSLRTGIVFEGIRVWIFTLANSVMALYLPALYVKPLSSSKKDISIWPDIIFAFVWSSLWWPFSTMRNPDPGALIFDPYGFFLWMVLLVYALIRTRDGEAQSFFHLIFVVSLISGLYGILQYAGRDVIWSSPVTPYGGRPVSTFGNPNFLSSYLLLACPLAVSFGLIKERSESIGYFFVAVVVAVSILCTLTRSTYVGLLAAFFFLALLLVRSENLKSLGKIGGLAVLVILLIFIFPGSPVSKIQSPLARFTEIFQAMKTGESYGPWHQRILIWSSAWDMVKERFLFGKGWGCFELFYPFYQGAYLFFPVFYQWRTHANNAHNIMMEIWSQTGWIGMGFALLFFISLLIGGLLIVKKKTEGPSRIIGAALLAGWLGMVVDNFFGNVSIFFAMPAFLFWWNMGSLYNEASAIKVLIRPATALRDRGLQILMMGFCLFVIAYYGSRWKQEVSYFEGFKAAKNGQLQESVNALEKAYLWFPGEVNSNYELGNSYARMAKALSDKNLPEESRKNVEKAIWAYSAALKANPGYDEIYFNLGVTQLQSGAREAGIKNLRTAVLINPLMRNGYGTLSSQYVEAKDLNSARAVLEQSVRAFPRDKEFWNNLAYVYEQLGEFEKSYGASKKAVQLDPMFKTAWQNYQAICSKLKKNDPLLQMPVLLGEMTRLLNEKKFAEAKKPASQLAALLPDNVDVGLSYANVLFYVGEIPAAIHEYERLLKLEPEFGAAHSNLGRIYLAQKDYKQARFHLDKALQINPQDAEAKQALSSVPM